MKTATIHIRLKPGVLDPEGKAIEHSLMALGFAGIGQVRQARSFEIDLNESDSTQARDIADAMCRQLLANPVIETYDIEISD
ncbi:MAG: phosphoribosylformylglycinamidine synthase subunit PurS [Hyphomicrobiales bacterium]|nr:phosphoribosylformylglycinamidine synthase subunit PurS [Hyphomicrobiales bacterium]